MNCKKSDVFIFTMLAMYSMFKTINYYYYFYYYYYYYYIIL